MDPGINNIQYEELLLLNIFYCKIYTNLRDKYLVDVAERYFGIIHGTFTLSTYLFSCAMDFSKFFWKSCTHHEGFREQFLHFNGKCVVYGSKFFAIYNFEFIVGHNLHS